MKKILFSLCVMLGLAVPTSAQNPMATVDINFNAVSNAFGQVISRYELELAYSNNRADLETVIWPDSLVITRWIDNSAPPSSRQIPYMNGDSTCAVVRVRAQVERSEWGRSNVFCTFYEEVLSAPTSIIISIPDVPNDLE